MCLILSISFKPKELFVSKKKGTAGTYLDIFVVNLFDVQVYSYWKYVSVTQLKY